MDMLLQLGFYYSELETFVKAERFSASRKIRSQYKCALANGIQGEERCEEEREEHVQSERTCFSKFVIQSLIKEIIFSKSKAAEKVQASFSFFNAKAEAMLAKSQRRTKTSCPKYL